jgi:aryl sulfotransferase
MPPFILRCVMGVFMAFFRRVILLFEKLGVTVRVIQSMTAQASKRLEAKNPFKGYKPTAHDVFVATYVKSGTNWMMQIAHQLVNHGRGEFEHIHYAVPWPDTKLMGGGMRGYAIPIEDDSVWKASPEQKRVIKTHFGWDLLPYSPDARYIMVIRDPKDVFVSSYFFFAKNGSIGDSNISVETWLKLFLSERFVVWESWAANAAGYWAQRHRPNVRVVSFKAMKRDLPGTVRMLADFLGVQISQQELQAVCEKSSFDYMKRIDEKFRMWQMIPWIQVGPMVRKGTHGGSSELLTTEQQRQIDEFCIAELKRLGSDFPYDEFCDPVPQIAQPEVTV